MGEGSLIVLLLRKSGFHLVFEADETGPVQAVLLVHEVLSYGPLYFSENFLHNAVEVVLVLHLEFLVVAPALIGGAAFENFAETIENLGSPSSLLTQEIFNVFHHELEVDLVLKGGPAACLYFLLVDLQTKFFHMVVIRLEAFLFGVLVFGNGPF